MFPYREHSFNRSQSAQGKTFSVKQSHYKQPPNYMVVSFPQEYVDYTDEEGYVGRPASSVEKHNKIAVTLLQKKAIAHPHPSTLPSLKSSFIMPKQKALKKDTNVRNMMGRSDVGCQVGLDLTRAQLDGLQEFQSWTTDSVEPFLKGLKKAIKANRPANISDYVISYCMALADGQEEPKTIDEEETQLQENLDRVPASEN